MQDLTLLDSLGKRIDFLKEVCSQLGLARVDCVHARAEEYAAGHRQQYDIAASRAVANLNVLCELALPLVKVGGQFLAMKSVSSDDEIAGARGAIGQLGGRIADIRDYTVPETEVRHRLVIVEKVKDTPAIYPRSFALRREGHMGKIIAVVSGKGGTGKTSFTANTGLALASLDQHVLCMDCDITLRNLDLALGLSDRALMDFSDVLAERCTLEQAVVTHEKYRSLDLLAAPMADRPLALTVRQLAALAREIREKYDWCLMDAPAGLGQGFKMAACMADQVIVVTTTDISAMRDAQRTAMELSAFPANAVHLVVGRVSRKTLRALHTTIDDAIDTAGLPLLGVIPEDEDVPYCLNRGLVLRDRNFYAARAYENIAKRIMGRKMPLMKI